MRRLLGLVFGVSIMSIGTCVAEDVVMPSKLTPFLTYGDSSLWFGPKCLDSMLDLQYTYCPLTW